MASVNSTTFIKEPPGVLNEQEIVSTAKQVLSNRIFLGSYKERRYVVVLGEYRDVVEVSPAETELQYYLDSVVRKLKRFYGIKWVGITEPGIAGSISVYCLWVKLTNLPFGQFWFQIRQVKYEQGEVILRLKCIRSSHSQDHLQTLPRLSNTPSVPDAEKSLKPADSTSSEMKEYTFDFDPGAALCSLYEMACDSIKQIAPFLTWNNVVLALKLTLALMIALISLGLTLVRCLGEYFLRLLRELSNLLNSNTPIILKVLDLITKTIGGLYILLAMMWRTRSAPPVPPTAGIAQNRLMLSAPNWRERNTQLKEALRLIPHQQVKKNQVK